MLIQPANPAPTKIIIHRRPGGHRRKIARIRTKISSSGNGHHCILYSYNHLLISSDDHLIICSCDYMMLVQPGRSNAMTVVAIVNQKGGVGKTTLATNLAWSLARTGIMLLVNAGPQGSARDWNHFNITGPDGLFVQSHPT